jgi:hypothetical protein
MVKPSGGVSKFILFCFYFFSVQKKLATNRYWRLTGFCQVPYSTSHYKAYKLYVFVFGPKKIQNRSDLSYSPDDGVLRVNFV